MNSFLGWNSFVCRELALICLSPWTNIEYLEIRALNTAYLCKLFFLGKKKIERHSKKADDYDLKPHNQNILLYSLCVPESPKSKKGFRQTKMKKFCIFEKIEVQLPSLTIGK